MGKDDGVLARFPSWVQSTMAFLDRYCTIRMRLSVAVPLPIKTMGMAAPVAAERAT